MFLFSVLCKVKIRFLDTVIRLEHVPLDSATGVAMEIHIKNLEYSDEAGSDPSPVAMDSTKGYVVSAFSTKRFYLEGVSFHADEFPSRARTFSKNIMTSRASTPESKVSSRNKNPFFNYNLLLLLVFFLCRLLMANFHPHKFLLLRICQHLQIIV